MTMSRDFTNFQFPRNYSKTSPNIFITFKKTWPITAFRLYIASDIVREKAKFNLHKLKLTQQQQIIIWNGSVYALSLVIFKRERERERESDSWRLKELRMESLWVSISQPWMQRLQQPSDKGSAPTALSSFPSTSTIRRKNSFKKKESSWLEYFCNHNNNN